MGSDNRGPELLGLIWTFTTVSIATVALKLFTRRKFLQGLGWDDFFIFLSLVSYCLTLFARLKLTNPSVTHHHLHLNLHLRCPCGDGQAYGGAGDADNSRGGENQLDRYGFLSTVIQGVQAPLMSSYTANPFGIMAYSFPNISVAILLERLLAPNKLRTRFLYLLASTQVVIASISCILLFVQCIPSAHLWNPTIPAKCFPTGTVSRYSYFVGCRSSQHNTSQHDRLAYIPYQPSQPLLTSFSGSSPSRHSGG